jgi:hypothetical protein
VTGGGGRQTGAHEHGVYSRTPQSMCMYVWAEGVRSPKLQPYGICEAYAFPLALLPVRSEHSVVFRVVNLQYLLDRFSRFNLRSSICYLPNLMF